mmetsp:Transcript_12329/g.17938  ORF Transcript_12329/g.17938 Transcript_12329/m.17938 type:complete len:143 (-) Transcript_12329:242-670(-)|eukprot:CAMPEP_0197237110 /NCGR_PEP_ID=MMETSP1429-20130617/4033_1 /TAXON_ID=49237 /ORGANISM="Chaetoceros  sp., Strain UNC1202" /LENGTH=142 /DNA_ID=CAMNT_0042696043 /DNA_START=79 /DNA_END=507 /DNA_ORIENTATION=-
MFTARASSMIRSVAALRTTALRTTISKPMASNNAPAVFSEVSMMNLRFFSDDASDSITGHVKWFDSKKGFGFITPSDGSGDVFVHQTVINSDGFRSLAEGEEVLYNIKTDPSGRRSADNVTGPDGGYVQGAPRRDNYDNEGY